MNQNQFAELTDQELLQEAKKMKSLNMMNAVLIGVMIGVAIYSTLKNGLGFFTFFPVIFGVILFKSSEKSKALNLELKARNLK